MARPHGHSFDADLVCSSCGVSYRERDAACKGRPRPRARPAAGGGRRARRDEGGFFTPEEIAAIERVLGKPLMRWRTRLASSKPVNAREQELRRE